MRSNPGGALTSVDKVGTTEPGLRIQGTERNARLETVRMVECLPSSITGPRKLMTNEAANRVELLQGTLDMLILRTLLFGPAHGHAIAKHIQRTSDQVLQVEHGSLYPALHRLERKGWIAFKWEKAKDRNREFKYYRLTPAGKKHLVAQESKWKHIAAAIARVMSPAQDS
jgi:PadR family transcriptional regulator, regulatory protein PadR